MKTAIQELIEDVKRMEQGLDVEELSAYVYKRATELLEKEREQIEEAANFGITRLHIMEDAEQYYNETFKQ
jgi:hypothetical protein